MRFTHIIGMRIVAAVLMAGLAACPVARADSLTVPVRIGTSTAFSGPTLGIPRWKGYMQETNPNRFWACYGNGSRSLSNISFTTDGGTTWSTTAIQIDPIGYLDMHASIAGRNGNLYVTWPASSGIKFRKFADPIVSNADGGSVVTMAGSSYRHRSNIMVQNTGRIWLFTRLTGSSSQNVLYNYSDNEGVSWSHGTAFATNASEVRIGSMPYAGGNPALVVLYLNSPRGFEYYLWNGTSFEARADHSIYPVNMGYTRAFAHNVIRDTTFHLIFGDGSSLHHVWKHFNNGAGTWNHEIIDNSATTLNSSWYPTTTVKGDDLYLFYCKRTTTSESSSEIYYKKWSQQSQSWTEPELVSTDAASVSNVQPNTCFQIPAYSPYVPVFWQSGASPYNILFAKVEVQGTPAIACPTDTLEAAICGIGVGCVPLTIENCSSVVVSPSSSTWSNGQLSFPATESGIQVFHVTGHAVDTSFGSVTCDVTVSVELSPIVQITCPPAMSEDVTCYPATLSVALPIVNQMQVQVPGAVWSMDLLTFDVDTSGVYTFLVTASNAASVATCEVRVEVVVAPSLDLYLADSDLISSPTGIVEGDTIMISAVVHSDVRSQPASDISVRFYSGDPDIEGVLIGTGETIHILNAGESDTISVSHVVTAQLPHDIHVRVDSEALISECDEGNNTAMLTLDGSSSTVTAHGTVLAGVTPAQGVVIDLLDSDGSQFLSGTTDFSGQYSFTSIPPGDYVLDLQLPLGFGPVGASSIAIPSGVTDFLANFALQDLATGSGNDFWWWKFRLSDLRDGAASTHNITRSDIDSYCALIFDHFCDRSDGLGIAIPGVTCTGTPVRALTFDDVATLWFDVLDNSNSARTGKYFLANLFNIASVRISERSLVSLDGATASQAITFFAARFLDGGSEETLLWYNLSRMFSGVMIAQGIIPLTTAQILYKSDSDAPVETLPNRLKLSQNYPNPFNPTTTIAYSIPAQSRVLIRVYNVLGQAITTLVDDERAPGSYQVVWDGTDHNGRPVGSGIYLYRMSANNQTEGKKMLLLK